MIKYSNMKFQGFFHSHFFLPNQRGGGLTLWAEYKKKSPKSCKGRAKYSRHHTKIPWFVNSFQK